MGSSLDDLSAFPADIKRAFGFALREVQKGATPLAQFGSGVFELRERLAGDAYRSVHVVSLRSAVYILHAFKKKSKSGKAMPREDIATIAQRLKRARAINAAEEKDRDGQ
jgi:phage-related protein